MLKKGLYHGVRRVEKSIKDPAIDLTHDARQMGCRFDILTDIRHVILVVARRVPRVWLYHGLP